MTEYTKGGRSKDFQQPVTKRGPCGSSFHVQTQAQSTYQSSVVRFQASQYELDLKGSRRASLDRDHLPLINLTSRGK